MPFKNIFHEACATAGRLLGREQARLWLPFLGREPSRATNGSLTECFRVPRSRVPESMWARNCIVSCFNFLQVMVFRAKPREGFGALAPEVATVIEFAPVPEEAQQLNKPY